MIDHVGARIASSVSTPLQKHHQVLGNIHNHRRLNQRVIRSYKKLAVPRTVFDLPKMSDFQAIPSHSSIDSIDARRSFEHFASTEKSTATTRKAWCFVILTPLFFIVGHVVAFWVGRNWDGIRESKTSQGVNDILSITQYCILLLSFDYHACV